MKTPLLLRVAFSLSACIVTCVHAGERIEMDTTYVKANKELPKILFVVPWQDLKPGKREEQTLVLHSLYGDLFDPKVPRETSEPRHTQ